MQLTGLKLKRMTPLERVNKCHSLLLQALTLLSGEPLIDLVDASKAHIATAHNLLEQYRRQYLEAAPKEHSRMNLLTDKMRQVASPPDNPLGCGWLDEDVN